MRWQTVCGDDGLLSSMTMNNNTVTLTGNDVVSTTLLFYVLALVTDQIMNCPEQAMMARQYMQLEQQYARPQNRMHGTPRCEEWIKPMEMRYWRIACISDGTQEREALMGTN
jgi:hypothetical protein